ncbi:hypothetical protein, partial [Pseudonocardia sp.]|uniref:hypothetical protein n=1 Tax=Pseudonocardia sp. TaxID=60912 RepID=UPI002637F81E
PECGEVAEVLQRPVLSSTDGPVELGRVCCARGHWFLLPMAMLSSAPGGHQAQSRGGRTSHGHPRRPWDP